MNDQEITIAKFQACMQNSVTKFGVFDLSRKKELHEYDFEEFNKILIKHDLEEYRELMFRYFLNILEINKLNSEAGYSYEFSNLEEDEFRLELLEALLFLLSNQSDYIKSVIIKKAIKNENYTIENDHLIYEIEQLLHKLFLKWFKKIYSIEEAVSQLQSKKYEAWIIDWAKDNHFLDFDIDGNFYDKIEDEKVYVATLTNENFSGKEIKTNIIKNFKWTHPQVEELTTENIIRLITIFKDRLSKRPGAPSKNEYLTVLAYEIADLVRIDKFIKNEKLTDIDKIKVVPDNKRFIYKCLDFWGLIPIRGKNTTTPTKYMNTTLRQGVKYLPPNHSSERNRRLTALKEKISPFLSL